MRARPPAPCVCPALARLGCASVLSLPVPGGSDDAHGPITCSIKTLSSTLDATKTTAKKHQQSAERLREERVRRSAPTRHSPMVRLLLLRWHCQPERRSSPQRRRRRRCLSARRTSSRARSTPSGPSPRAQRPGPRWRSGPSERQRRVLGSPQLLSPPCFVPPRRGTQRAHGKPTTHRTAGGEVRRAGLGGASAGAAAGAGAVGRVQGHRGAAGGRGAAADDQGAREIERGAGRGSLLFLSLFVLLFPLLLFSLCVTSHLCMILSTTAVLRSVR